MCSDDIHERAKALGFRVRVGRGNAALGTKTFTVYLAPKRVLFKSKSEHEVLAYLLGWEHAILSGDPTIDPHDLKHFHFLGAFKVKD